jgi:MFS family permease
MSRLTLAPGTTTASDGRTFTSLGLQCVVNAFVYSTYLARLPDIRDQAHLSIGAMGVVMMVGNLAGFVATFFTAPVIRRLGSKRVMVAGGILYVFALPVIGGSGAPAVLVTAIVGMMVMNTFVDVAIAMQSAAFSLRRERPVMSRLSGLYSLGTVGGGFAASLIAAAGFDVSLHLLLLAAVLGAALLFVAPGLLPGDEPARRDDGPHPRTSWWRIGTPALVLGLASALTVPLDIVPGEWATFRVRDDLGGTAAAATAAYFVFTLGMALGRFGGDRAAVRLGRRPLMWGSVVLSAAGLVAAATVPLTPVLLAGFFLAGLGVSTQSPVLTEAAAVTPGPAFTALFVGNRLAGLLTPLAVGTLAGTSLGVGTAMTLVVVPSAVLLTVFAGRALGRPRGEAAVGP